MDAELEDLIDKNNTAEMNNFDVNMPTWVVVRESVAIAFICVGMLANFTIIYMIARNARMRTKANLVLMHFAINDALFLISNTHIVSGTLELLGDVLDSPFYICVMHYLDIGFQMNEALAIFIIVSNTLMKSDRIQVRWVVVGMYTFIVCNLLLHLSHCHAVVIDLLGVLVLLLLFGMGVFKEFNNCYKKWCKKDPLQARTLFRLNIGRIYIGSWFSTFIIYQISSIGAHYYWYTIAQHCLMTSMYILIYIVCAEKNFQICLLNMLQCKGAGDYDVDATITFAEEDSTDDRSDSNRVNINFNASENPTHSPVDNTNRISIT